MVINTVVSINAINNINAINSPRLNKYGIITSNDCMIRLHNSNALYFSCGLTVVDSIGLSTSKRSALLATLDHNSVLGVYKREGCNIVSSDISELKINIKTLYYIESKGMQYVI